MRPSGDQFPASHMLCSLPTVFLGALLAVTFSTTTLAQTRSLETYQIVKQSIPQPLTNQPGNREQGLAVALDRARGHCLLCHSVTSLNEPSQGNIGPALDNVGARLTAAELRLRLVDGTKINPSTIMPAYYRTEGLHQVSSAYRNQPVLSAQEIEDVVAWLSALRGTDDH